MRRKTGRHIKNLEGRTFNNWDVLSLSFVDKKGAHWACMCRLCGKVYDVRSDALQDGSSTKCRPCADFERKYGYARTV